MSRAPNLCVYCGQAGITKEHILGAWAKKHAPKRFVRSTHIVSRPILDGHVNIWQNSKGALDRPGAPRDRSLKIACKVCNNGWMRKVAEDAIPILKNMNYGYWGNLDNCDKLKLSRWIVMFSMSNEFSDKKTVCIDFDERRNFSLQQHISPSWHIGIGYAEPIRWSDRTYHRAFRLREGATFCGNPKSQLTALLFGKLAILSHFSEKNLNIDFDKEFSKVGLIKLWPVRERGFFKPSTIHDENTIDELINHFSNLMMM